MEEAWELAVVSGDYLAEEAFTESGLEFVKINEFALRYHLQRIRDYCSDFSESYRFLYKISAAGKANLPASSEVWGAVIECAEDLAGIANALSPSRTGKKGDFRVLFTRKRAEALQILLRLGVDDRKKLVDFRNRVHHEDEDFDDWYFRNMTKAPAGGATLISRLVTWGESPVTTDVYGCASAYDAKVGHVHFYDSHYNLHKSMKNVELIKTKIANAEKRLTEISGRETKVALK